MKIGLALAASAAAALLLGPGSAAAAVILYSDFETPDVAHGSYDVFAFADGWTKGLGTAGIEIQDHAGGGDPAPTGGHQFVELDSHPGPNSNSSMFFGGFLGGLQSYQISFLYSPRPGVGPASNPISLYLNGALLDPPGTLTGGPLGATSWASYSADFIALAGSRIEFRAEGTEDTLGGYVDNIQIATLGPDTRGLVPEPASWAMMLVGFGGMGALLRHRRRALAIA